MALEKIIGRVRLSDVDRAKGLAIFLVVLGHLFVNDAPPDHKWYFLLNVVIYKFHMPFFMFLTGLVMFYTLPNLDTFADCAAYAKKKLSRFALAFLLFAVIVWVSKFAAAKFLYVERPTGDLLSDFVTVLIRPRYSFCGSLWYVYVICIYFLIIPPLLKLFKQRLEILLIPALILHFVPSTTYFALEQVFEYMFVFLLGGYAARRMHEYTQLIDKYSYTFMTTFVAVAVFAFFIDIPKIMLGLLSLPALHSFVRWRFFDRSLFLRLFGKYTFPIYLMNTLAIGFPRAVMKKYLFWNGTVFGVALILLLSGLFLPIAAQKFFISRVPGLKSIIR